MRSIPSVDRGDRRSPSTGIEVVSSLKRLDFVDPLLEFSINLRVNREIYVVKRYVLEIFLVKREISLAGSQFPEIRHLFVIF